MTFDPDSFRAVLGRFASGVTVVTTRDDDGRALGMTVSAFSSVSLDPPLVMVCVDTSASMHRALVRSTYFGVSILGSEQEELARRFAHAEASDRFDGLGYERGGTGVPLFAGAAAQIECRRTETHAAGDHTIVLAEVVAAQTFEARPLLYYRGGYALLER
ncbi:MAG: flavin reductase family protein [Gemmatimonadaceae bacterium]